MDSQDSFGNTPLEYVAVVLYGCAHVDASLARRSEQMWVVELLEQSLAELAQPRTLLSQLRATSGSPRLCIMAHGDHALGSPEKPAARTQRRSTAPSDEALRRYSTLKEQEEKVSPRRACVRAPCPCAECAQTGKSFLDLARDEL